MDPDAEQIRERVRKFVDSASVDELISAEALFHRYRDIPARRQENRALSDGTYWNQRPQILSLLLATVPRLGQYSHLRLLSKDVLRNIAGFLPWPRLNVRFAKPTIGTLSLDGRSVELSQDEWADHGIPFVALEGPVRCSHVEYLEFEFSDAWCGSTLRVHRSKLRLDTIDGEGAEERGGTSVNGMRVQSWDECWKNIEPYRTKVGILLDFTRGTVSWRLNDVNGPRVPLGDGWEDGVEIRTEGQFPDLGMWTPWVATVSCPGRVPDDLHSGSEGHGLCKACARFE